MSSYYQLPYAAILSRFRLAKHLYLLVQQLLELQMFICGDDCYNASFILKVAAGQAEEVKIVELNEQEHEQEYEDAELMPCQTYNYQVATMVGEQESDRTELVNLSMPPR